MVKARQKILVVGSFIVAATADMALGEILKPAGQVPEHSQTQSPVQDVSDFKRQEASKSRVVPLRRSQVEPSTKFTVATNRQKNAKIDSAKNVVDDLKQVVNQQSKIKEQKTLPVPSAPAISAIPAYPTSAEPKPLIEYASSSKSTKQAGVPTTKVEAPVEDAWDSASKRFDKHEPAKAIARGVRVEDIIEPTSDYQYVASRRANPFVPSLVLGRPSIIQKELSPNDVEIPIISPLQSFSASQLAVIGVWEGGDGVWKALVQTPTNQGIETKLGDPAGNSGGRIMSITPEAVIVREFSIRTDGTREYRDIPLYMGSDREATPVEVSGGRLILKPGASAPIVEGPNSPTTSSTIIEAPKLVPSKVQGTLSTIVPGEELQKTKAIAPGVQSNQQKDPSKEYEDKIESHDLKAWPAENVVPSSINHAEPSSMSKPSTQGGHP